MHLGPGQRGNAGNAGANRDANDCINQLAAAITQMAIRLTQINGMPILLEVQQFGGEIPCFEVFFITMNIPLGMNEVRPLQLVIALEILITPIVAPKEIAMRMKGHAM